MGVESQFQELVGITLKRGLPYTQTRGKFFWIAEREAGGETEMGLAAFRQVTKGYHAGVQGGLRAEHHGEEAGHVRPE